MGTMDKILNALRKLIPSPVFRALQSPYHYALAYLGAWRFGFPSRRLVVIAVTGTKGKTSTTELINSILEEAGHFTALANTIRFKVGNESKRNLFKMTMPGRFFQQHFLAQARRAGCTHVVMEMSSEGAKQHRHRFVDLDALVLTNLAPEHIEAHGSFEAYKKAKENIAKQLSISRKKNHLLVLNADEKEFASFRTIPRLTVISYSLADVAPYRGDDRGSAFTFEGKTVLSPLPGVFSVYNMLAAATLSKALGVKNDAIKRGLEKVHTIAGRAERIEEGQGFPVIVDYAHTPESLQALYRAFDGYSRVCVLGNTGGGRDRWKRKDMGAIADQMCDTIILTNEDPYDENPRAILADMEQGIKTHKPETILDRRDAIARALTLGAFGKKSAVLITGKGTDPYIMEAGGKKTPWSDSAVTREELKRLLHK